MRTLLTLMAAFALVISVGCAPEANTANNSSNAGTAKPAESASSSTTMAKETDDAPVGDMQTVSLKVPGMTWGGCEGAVSSALEGLGFTGVETNCGERTCSFKAPKDADIKAKIDEIASSKNKLEGWSMVE